MRALGHRMVDDMFSYYETLRDRPVWQPMPPAVRERFAQPLPVQGQGAPEVYQDFLDTVLPYVTGNTHPRFWGWVCGNGSGMAMLAELLAGAINSSVDGFDDAGSHVESQVIDWCKAMLGWRPEASGLLVSGCSMANFVGLAVARNTAAGYPVKTDGLLAGPQLTRLRIERDPLLGAQGGAAAGPGQPGAAHDRRRHGLPGRRRGDARAHRGRPGRRAERRCASSAMPGR